MARIVVAQEAGACFGVERALKMVLAEADAAPGPIHTLGPLIHNPLVVADLEQRGVSVVADPADAQAGSTLFMRTHGVPPEVERRAVDLGLNVKDATCPFVKKVHKAAERLCEQGYQVIVVGEAGHPEVEGTVGHAPGALVIGAPEELDGVALERRVGLVVQTTLAENTLRAVVAALVGRCDELLLVDTICDATEKRQRAAAELAAEADVMIVVGGRNSANTTHLAQICSAACEHTHHIEHPDELDATWFAHAALVGITAGASTPASHIEAVRTRIHQLV